LTFNDFNFDQKLVDGLDSMGYDKPTPIQEQAIPLILQNKDLIACAQTGTGKTAAYVLPILNKIVQGNTSHLNTLIIAPTRELAQQIDQQIEGFSYFLGVSSIPVYGGGDGAAWDQQHKAMREGADIIIATPGRLIAMLTSAGSMDMSSVQHLILDEADRMLDMGFYEDIMRIVNYLPANRQTLLFSATMPPKIRALAQKILNDPEQINIAISKPAEGILQQAYLAYDAQKLGLLKYILNEKEHKSVIIFASTKEKVKDLNKELYRSGLSIKAFHSDLEQSEREEIMRAFKNKELQMLIGTDILSRGIDVDGISLVVNFDVPPDPEDYIHRIGRTARAETTGTAITFINDRDQRKFYDIENLIGKDIPKLLLPTQFGEAPVYQPEVKAKRSFGGGGGNSKKKPFKGKKPNRPIVDNNRPKQAPNSNKN
jgi:ATP-dependent RNA helicase RhlE